MTRCCAKVQSSNWRSTQCSNKGVIELDGKFFCKIHDPEEVEKRRRRREEKSKRSLAEFRKQSAGPKFYAALKAIAEGHEDPKNLAAKRLKNFNVLFKIELRNRANGPVCWDWPPSTDEIGQN